MGCPFFAYIELFKLGNHLSQAMSSNPTEQSAHRSEERRPYS